MLAVCAKILCCTKVGRRKFETIQHHKCHRKGQLKCITRTTFGKGQCCKIMHFDRSRLQSQTETYYLKDFLAPFSSDLQYLRDVSLRNLGHSLKMQMVSTGGTQMTFRGIRSTFGVQPWTWPLYDPEKSNNTRMLITHLFLKIMHWCEIGHLQAHGRSMISLLRFLLCTYITLFIISYFPVLLDCFVGYSDGHHLLTQESTVTCHCHTKMVYGTRTPIPYMTSVLTTRPFCLPMSMTRFIWPLIYRTLILCMIW